MNGRLALAFSGPRKRDVFEGLLDAGLAGDGGPSEANIDDRESRFVGDWTSRAFAKCRVGADLWWKGAEQRGFLSYSRRQPVKVSRRNTTFALDTLLPLLRDLPFELCSALSPYYAEWKALPDYDTYGFADAHWGHGWMCAFKGAGHDRLVSRRWLHAGDWYLHREEDIDLSVILFHDPEADPKTAFEQALPNHRRMGISSTGGFIQSLPWVYDHDLSGLYDPATRTLRLVVLGREVPESEMTDAAMYRHEHRDDPEQPVDNVAFVFVDPAEAAPHLHGLWLRELQCWAIVDGVETRLDLDYTPPPADPPQWVQRLRAERGE